MSDGKKIYRSFHDIPPREYMYFPKGVIEADKPGRFSRTEIVHLLISIVVLTIAFSFAFTNNNLFYGIDINSLISFLPISLLAVLTAFFFHELSHKFMAQKYGLWSEYRMYPLGLLLALLLAFFTGFVFAAPGAVMFRGDSRSFETGRIATAGPLANMVVALVTLILYFVFFESIIGQVIGFICLINAFLATFNLLPLGSLDGAKIVRWNATAWVILFSIGIAIMVYGMTNISFAP
ncbi:MAG: site-2 protease family protein [Candidatus Thermoplasmatota archaeon]|jgi:Zn-dependent protease|nr:site-2 protease family protein [Candidatus Thermoplasmatota archaeon]